MAEPVGCRKSDLCSVSYTPPRLPEFQGQLLELIGSIGPRVARRCWASYKGDPDLTALRPDAAKHVVSTPTSPESVVTTASGLLLLLPAGASRLRAVWCYDFQHLSSISSLRACAQTATRVLVGADVHPCGIHAAGALCRLGCAGCEHSSGALAYVQLTGAFLWTTTHPPRSRWRPAFPTVQVSGRAECSESKVGSSRGPNTPATGACGDAALRVLPQKPAQVLRCDGWHYQRSHCVSRARECWRGNALGAFDARPQIVAACLQPC